MYRPIAESREGLLVGVLSVSFEVLPHASLERYSATLHLYQLLAFVVLLALILDPSDANASGGDQTIAHVVERVQQLIAR